MTDAQQNGPSMRHYMLPRVATMLKGWTSRHDSQQWLVLIFAGLGGFLFGYDTGVISGALPYLEDDLIPHASPASKAAIDGVRFTFLWLDAQNIQLCR
jgi:hypothetical protein